MKPIKLKFLVIVALLFTFAAPVFAVENLQLSVQASNAIVSWPSSETNGETFIVQYRQTLSATDSWQTLTDDLAAATDTNLTFFIHSNSVQYPLAGSGSGTNGGGGVPSPGDTNDVSGGGTNNWSVDTGFYRVVRDGAHLFEITNGTVLSGVVTIPVELANGSGTVSTMSLTEDDSPVGNSIQTAPLNVPLALTVDTTLMSNGVHEVSASARWDDTNGNFWEADSPAVSVTVSNEISFPNWMPEFGELGNTLLINATSAHTNADWQIDVYDSQYSYVGSFTGHTDDGNISVVWNLVDYNGVAHTNDNFFICAVSTTFDDPQTAYGITPPTYKVTDPWSGPGAWVIGAQHAFDNLVGSSDLYDELDGFVIGAHSSSYTVLPSPDSNGHAFTIHFQDAFENSSWSTFRQALYDPRSRNLVYFGHGGPTGIGYNSHDTNQSILVSEIASVLHTIPAGQTNRHAFRFVFLDGCSTAKGTLPEAFGIIHKEISDLDVYTAASLRPSAFVGWSADKYIGFLGGGINYDHIYFIQHIEYFLGTGDGIQQAITDAAGEPDVGFIWTSQFKVYGFFDLHFSQYND